MYPLHTLFSNKHYLHRVGIELLTTNKVQKAPKSIILTKTNRIFSKICWSTNLFVTIWTMKLPKQSIGITRRSIAKSRRILGAKVVDAANLAQSHRQSVNYLVSYPFSPLPSPRFPGNSLECFISCVNACLDLPLPISASSCVSACDRVCHFFTIPPVPGYQ